MKTNVLYGNSFISKNVKNVFDIEFIEISILLILVSVSFLGKCPSSRLVRDNFCEIYDIHERKQCLCCNDVSFEKDLYLCQKENFFSDESKMMT